MDVRNKERKELSAHELKLNERKIEKSKKEISRNINK